MDRIIKHPLKFKRFTGLYSPENNKKHLENSFFFLIFSLKKSQKFIKALTNQPSPLKRVKCHKGQLSSILRFKCALQPC